jgi:hypothetical protein
MDQTPWARRARRTKLTGGVKREVEENVSNEAEHSVHHRTSTATPGRTFTFTSLVPHLC